MHLTKVKAFLDGHEVKYVVMSHSKAYTAQGIAAVAHISGKFLAKTVGGISLGVRHDNVFHFMAVEEGFNFGEMHIELLATFRGSTARKDRVDATNLVQGAAAAGFPSLCLYW